MMISHVGVDNEDNEAEERVELETNLYVLITLHYEFTVSYKR